MSTFGYRSKVTRSDISDKLGKTPNNQDIFINPLDQFIIRNETAMSIDTPSKETSQLLLNPPPLLAPPSRMYSNTMRKSLYHKLMPACLQRWSPRAFSAEGLAEEEVKTLFEAARWAPSFFNEQPWRFVYTQEQKAKEHLLGAMSQSNRVWAARAPLVAIAFSHMFYNHEATPNRWAAFDTGAAWMSFAYQAHHMGLVTHAVAGFDEEMVYQLTGVNPDEYVAMAMIVVGRPGDPNALPPKLREREHPSDRVQLAEIVYEFQLPDDLE